MKLLSGIAIALVFEPRGRKYRARTMIAVCCDGASTSARRSVGRVGEEVFENDIVNVLDCDGVAITSVTGGE